MATPSKQPGVDDVSQELTRAVEGSEWREVTRLIPRSDCSEHQRLWAVIHSVEGAPEEFLTDHISGILDSCDEEQLGKVVLHLLRRRLWTCLVQVLQRNISATQHRVAVEQASRLADDDNFVCYILPQCHDEELEQVLTHLVSRGLWKSVGNVFERGVSATQRKWAVEQAIRRAYDYQFVLNILPQCRNEELEQILIHLVSLGRWRSVGKVLERGVSGTQHRWAVEQASRHVVDDDFIRYILPQCHGEELDQVLTHLVSRGMWRSVGKILERGVSTTQHRWAVEQASRRTSHDSFVCYILPQCHNEELDHVISHLVSQGLWRLVGEVLERGVSTTQHRWAVEQASRHADERSFALCILHHCTEEELEQVLKHMVSRGLWESVDSVAHSDVSITQHILSQLVSRHWWEAVGRFLQRDISNEYHWWAVEQASSLASDFNYVRYILPQCRDEQLEEVLIPLVSQGQWDSVGKILERGVSATQHRWAVEQASRHANDYRAWDIFSQCHDEDLEHVLTHLVSRGLWKSVGKVLERGVSTTQHRWAVEQASRHVKDADFIRYILPQCHNEELEHVITHLVSQGLWESVIKVLKWDISTTQHRWVVEQVSRHAGDHYFVRDILPQCRDEELEHVITHLVSQGRWNLVIKVLERGIAETTKHADGGRFGDAIPCHWSEILVALFSHVMKRKCKDTQEALCRIVCDILYTWMTPAHGSRTHDTLFQRVIHYRFEVSLALDLIKGVTQEMYWTRSINVILGGLSERVSWQRPLCELLITSLLHTLCYVMCSDDREYTDSTEHTKQCVSGIYTHITACIKDNTDCIQRSTLKTIQNKQKWTAVFTEIADSHKTDPLFLLHFLQGSNLYDISRRGENDDTIFLVMLAVFPLFPQLQSVALRMMLHKKRWDVIRQACLSHVWEHDRRRLFKAAVEQRQWSVVRQWSDHTVHDDQREWAMKEAFKEEEWEVYLLLADHGLTVPEQMHAHYMVAKYADWDTVLQMVERGGDITEVSDLLENWVTGNLRKKPQGDATVYMKRCEKLIRMRLRFAKESVLSPMKALKRCRWGSVLFNILHEPTEDYFSRVLDKVIEQQEWHILMHLVRLEMNSAERNWLFPEMVRQQQWGVCRMLLECGVDDQLCVEALPELMERNQWTLVARVMEYDVDDAVRRQVMQCAFHRREGALFWHCLNVMEDNQPLTKETQVKLFHQAISRDIWQAVKPLMVEKDEPVIQHRDMAFLEAIEQHLWDVVDYCQLYRADINMKDENGETPLHREARKREWKAVEEIVLRDGKPNLLDKDGVSVLNRLIDYKQWNTVKIVIMYGGDIHLPARYSEYQGARHSPLQALIDVRQADVIQLTVMWCGDQKKGVNDRGETALHAVCDSDRRWDVMEDMIVRKVDPLAVTRTGKSALVYAVLNAKCPGRMVAECSRMGFSSHQPSVTGSQESVLEDITGTVTGMWERNPVEYLDRGYMRWNSSLTSPLVVAVLRDSPVLVLMLHESGACSRTELLALCARFSRLADLSTEQGRRAHQEVQALVERLRQSWKGMYIPVVVQHYSRLTHSLGRYVPLLRELATSPRSLQSACRLFISHRLYARRRCKFVYMDDLPLPKPLKNYLEFSDLCDSDYGNDLVL